MAIVSGNPVLSGFRGMLGGDLVFRRCGSKTVVAVKGSVRKRNSALQQRNCDRFKEASRYARTVLRDPDKKDHYSRLARKLGKHSAYNLIISQYMREAHVGLKDGTYSVPLDSKRAVFSVRQGGGAVKSVTVRVVSAGGEVVCEGPANRISGQDWVYAIRGALSVGDTVDVCALDSLGRTTRAGFGVRRV